MDNDVFNLYLGYISGKLCEKWEGLTLDEVQKILKNPPTLFLDVPHSLEFKLFNVSKGAYLPVNWAFKDRGFHNYITLYDNDRITLCPLPGSCAETRVEQLVIGDFYPEWLKTNSNYKISIANSHSFIKERNYNVYIAIYTRQTFGPLSHIPVFVKMWNSTRCSPPHILCYGTKEKLSSHWKEFLEGFGITLDNNSVINIEKCETNDYLQIITNLNNASDLETANLFMQMGFSYYQDSKFLSIYKEYLTSIFKIFSSDKL